MSSGQWTSYPLFCAMASKSFKSVNNPHKLDIKHMLNHFPDSWDSLQESQSGACITSFKVSRIYAFLKGKCVSQ